MGDDSLNEMNRQGKRCVASQALRDAANEMTSEKPPGLVLRELFEKLPVLEVRLTCKLDELGVTIDVVEAQFDRKLFADWSRSPPTTIRRLASSNGCVSVGHHDLKPGTEVVAVAGHCETDCPGRITDVREQPDGTYAVTVEVDLMELARQDQTP